MRALLIVLALALLALPQAAAATKHQIDLHELNGGVAYHLYPDEIKAAKGEALEITVVNPAEPNRQPHNLVFCAKPVGNDGCDERIAFSRMLDPGETQTINFVVPDVERVEFWCEVFGHKSGGMRGAIEVSAAAAAPRSSTPAPGPLAALALVALLALVRRRT